MIIMLVIILIIHGSSSIRRVDWLIIKINKIIFMKLDIYILYSSL